MFRENNNHKQVNMFDSTIGMDKRIVEKLKNSWAPVFFDEVFCKIDEKPFAVLYSFYGRPNFPINILLSLEYIKHMFNYSDDELIEQYNFNYLVNYAIGNHTLGYLNMAERTLYEFRERIYKYSAKEGQNADLLFEQFIKLTKNFAIKAGIKMDEQRMDSTMIMSNIKKAGRLSLAYDVLINGIKVIPDDKLPNELKEIKSSDFKKEMLYKVKADDKESKFETILNYAARVIEIAEKNGLDKENGIKLLKRFVNEQTEYDEQGKIYKARSKKTISSDSLQSAFDEDATYRSKSGKGQSGYSVNLAETCNSENEFQLVTDYVTNVNIVSDVEVAEERLPVIVENTGCNDMYLDGGYYHQEENPIVTAHYTDMTGKAPTKLVPSEFDIDEEEQRIKSCPNGVEPIHSAEKNGQIVGHFDKEKCQNCPNIDKCPIKKQKKTNVIRINKKAIEAEKNREVINKNKKESTSKRAAIEGTNSELKRSHGLGKLNVRGLVKCSVVTALKVTALNIKRYAKFTIKRQKQKNTGEVYA